MQNIVYVIVMMCAINTIAGFTKVILEGARLLDGSFISSSDIEHMYILKKNIQELVRSLDEHKNEITQAHFEDIKKKIMHLAKEVFVHEPHVKPLINTLIMEECTKRSNPSSDLLQWCQVNHGDEIKAFDTIITSVDQLYVFIKDLIYFLEDIIESCPIAQEELKQKIKTWKNFKIALQEAEDKKLVDIDPEKRHIFLQFVKYEKLSDMINAQCTFEDVLFLVNEFYAKRF